MNNFIPSISMQIKMLESRRNQLFEMSEQLEAMIHSKTAQFTLSSAEKLQLEEMARKLLNMSVSKQDSIDAMEKSRI